MTILKAGCNTHELYRWFTKALRVHLLRMLAFLCCCCSVFGSGNFLTFEEAMLLLADNALQLFLFSLFFLQHKMSIFWADTRLLSKPKAAGNNKIIDSALKAVTRAAWNMKARMAGMGMMAAAKKAAVCTSVIRTTDTPLRLSTSPTMSWK